MCALMLTFAACSPTVDPLPVFSVTITSATTTVRVAQTVQLAASARDINGVPVGATLRWSSLSPNIAAVDSVSGLVTGVAQGSATIRARAGGVDGTLGITVTP